MKDTGTITLSYVRKGSKKPTHFMIEMLASSAVLALELILVDSAGVEIQA